ncbi:MAG: helix-turn-helix domain-containing protein [Candidatus Limnocylindrus sp.]|jgi:excisionase family DNA binding protein
MSDKLLNAKQIADFLGISTDKVYVLVREAGMPHLRLGPRLLRFDREAVRSWASQRVSETTV